MNTYDESEIFSGLAALHWSAISDTDARWDQAYFRKVIERGDGPALELGCGAGRLLLAYLKEGLDVTGSDISADMLAACRTDAAAQGLTPRLYEQAMQDLDIPGEFATIYIPCGSFVCVMDREAAFQTLRRCFCHLRPGGALAFNIHLADYDYARGFAMVPATAEWQHKATKSLTDGRSLVVSHRETGVDPIEQTWHEERRYELFDGDRLLQTEVRSGHGRWYFRNEVLFMLQMAGFADIAVYGDYSDEPYDGRHNSTMVFHAVRSA